MAQKVMEPKEKVLSKEVQKVEVAEVEIQEVELQNETSYVSESLIETFWDQFEGAISCNREYRAQGQELFLNSIKQTTKFNEVYRNTLKGLFEDATKINSDLRKSLFQITDINSNEYTQEVTESLKGQVSEVANKLEELSLTPINTAFDLMEKSEKLVEQNSESFIRYTNEAWNAGEAITDNYLKQTREIHQNIAQRFEDSIGKLVAPSK
ncbi:hypothetical protein [Neobacillus cucumis]|uniref:hypothetical protein n=2 Tax=Neobacillus cucumis TaxID=1740721 RepID=UPI0019644347|nr:hypothetical protein [Neobacillus cucumis]MBM7652200.1 hypothetical protein [Neobacillus cucumis]